MKPIPYGKQHITDEDIQAVVDVLKSDYLTQGPAIKKFEEAFAARIGCKYAVAVSNGTAALHLSVLALGINPGDKVITTPVTFAASANCVLYCGGEVEFSDIDSDSYLIDIQNLTQLLENSPKGTYKGVIPVDFAGRAVDLEKLKLLASKYDLWILEDACHAPGGYFTDSNGIKQNCGNGNFADLAVFSFHPVKHIACGEGGMITTNRKDLYEKLLMLRTHGITRNPENFTNPTQFAIGEESSNEDYPGWYMEMQELGYNYRLTDFQSALGLSQLSRLSENIRSRNDIAKKYESSFSAMKGILSQSGVIEGHAYHLYIIHVKNRLGLYEHLKKHNIFAQIHYLPVHLMPYYRNKGFKHGDFSKSEAYYSTCISLPMFPSLTDGQQKFIIKRVKEYVS